MAFVLLIPSFCGEAVRADMALPDKRERSAYLEWAMLIFQKSDHPTVLIADDDPLVLRLIEVALVSEGYYTITASKGKQALAASRAHPGPIHLLLSDVQMPGMSGPELSANRFNPSGLKSFAR